jgi:radical SAM protein with 4Fe4S-binding SPASM domain
MVNPANMLIQRFPDEHYAVVFNLQTGFFARMEEPGYPDPFWSQHGPELLDISITRWCDRMCPTCYRSSSSSGAHMPYDRYEALIEQAARIGVLQVALGGGNPNQHPQFCAILRLTRWRHGVVPNYTTNGRGLAQEVVQATRDYCGAVAVSAYHPYDETQRAVETLANAGIKTNVHFVLSSSSLETAMQWLAAPPHFLNKVNALVFLNYKPVGRHTGSADVLGNSGVVERFIQLATETNHGFRIGFDSCMATGVARFSNTPTICYDACDAARFSMFVSEDMVAYPCSFMTSNYEGISIGDGNLQEVWQDGELFVQMRRRIRANGCPGCSRSPACRGGCPIFPEVNLCPDRR